MSSVRDVKRANAALARAVKAGDEHQIIETRRELAAVQLERAVANIIAAAPPLTDEQRARIASILAGGAK